MNLVAVSDPLPEGHAVGANLGGDRQTIETAYNYHETLFLEHSYLEWAGIASMIGPACVHSRVWSG